MPEVPSAALVVFYLFDVAEQIELETLRAAIGGDAARARLAPKAAAPSYLQYSVPPVIAEGDALGLPAVDSFRIRVKFFDYGVLSFALTRHVSGRWDEVAALAQEYFENEALEQQVERICRQLLVRFAPAMKGTRQALLAEDYLALAVTAPAIGSTSEQLVRQHGAEIARIVRGERQPLSAQEQEEILRHSLSYFAEDLVVPTWNAAFIYDNDAGAQAALEILEFANSQLLEFRYYDELLDVQLGRIYAQLQERRWWDSLAGRRYLRAAHQLHALFIDVNELTDRTQNALKMVGDIYAARLFNLTASRLGLERWKASVEEKLKTLNDIYTFAVEQVAISRGHFLELTIILILVLELVLFFMGIMR